MIKLDLNKAITTSALKKYAPSVKMISDKMDNLGSPGFEFLGWKDLPSKYDKKEFKEIVKKAKFLIKEKVEVLVVIGIGGSYLGPRAAIEMVNGLYPTNQKMEIVYSGNSISSTDLAQKLAYVEDKNFAINIISKSGTTTEPAIAFRLFKNMLEEKVGVNNASKYIVATTDANKGALLALAKENDYTAFVIPDNVGGRFSTLTPVGLFPMACAGLDINKVMSGAEKALKNYSSSLLMSNEAYQYAVARHVLAKKYPVELFVQYEPQMATFNEWWKQLAGESEGKGSKGVFPASVVFSTDLHSLGQFIQDGSKVLYETVLTVRRANMDLAIHDDEKNLDNLNYLTKKSVHEINDIAFEATMDAHVNVGKVPNIHIELEKMNEEGFGHLVYFMFRAIAMTAYLQGVNPFNQPGVEVYKSNMFKILGKPTN